MKKTKLILLSILLFLPFTLVAEVAVDNLIVSTPDYSKDSGKIAPKLGTYYYDVSWTGIPAAELVLDVQKKGLTYVVNTRVETSSGVGLFYSLNYNGQGEVSAVDYSPIRTTITAKENSRTKAAKIDFNKDGKIESVRTDSKYKGRLTTLDFDPNNQTFGPFSATFFALSLNWEKDQQRYFDVFNGKSRYLIGFKLVDEITKEVNGVERPVWVLSPSVKKLNTEKDPGKLRGAKIYVTADEHREILQIDSDVFIGTVKTKLDKFTPSAGQTSLAYDF